MSTSGAKISPSSLLLTLIHFVFTIITVLNVFWARLKKLAWKHMGLQTTRGEKYCQKYRLRKVPVHLGLVIGEECISISDVARIVAWSMVVGISHVTVYDHKGYCKSQEQLLRSSLTEKTKKAGHPTLQNNLQHTNGFSKNAESSLSVLGPEDGRQQLVSVARQLGSEVANQQLPCTGITVSYTDELMRAKFKFPDPDVVFRFGSVESLLGYLPWQIRLTEIFSLPTHRDLHFVDFVDALDTFADVKQRFGR